MELALNGYGDGDGSGYGSGYGDGDGSGKKLYFDAMLAPFARADATIAFWRSTIDGLPANGGSGSGTPANPGKVEEISGPLKLCSQNALHGTLDPEKWKGERWWIVALHHPVQDGGDKLGSLKREILADLGKCPF